MRRLGLVFLAACSSPSSPTAHRPTPAAPDAGVASPDAAPPIDAAPTVDLAVPRQPPAEWEAVGLDEPRGVATLGETVVVVARGAIWRSTDGGLSWRQAQAEDCGEVVVAAGRFVASGCNAGKVALASDDGAAWTEVPETERITILAGRDHELWGVTEDNQLAWRLDDKPWTIGAIAGCEGELRAITAVKQVYVMCENGVLVSADRESWKVPSFAAGVLEVRGAADDLWALVNAGCAIYRSSDGKTWKGHLRDRVDRTSSGLFCGRPMELPAMETSRATFKGGPGYLSWRSPPATVAPWTHKVVETFTPAAGSWLRSVTEGTHVLAVGDTIVKYDDTWAWTFRDGSLRMVGCDHPGPVVASGDVIWISGCWREGTDGTWAVATSDAGAHWSERWDAGGILIQATAAGVLYGTEGPYLMTSRDDGSTWRPVSDTSMADVLELPDPDLLDFLVLQVGGGYLARESRSNDMISSRDGAKWAPVKWTGTARRSSTFKDPKKNVTVATTTLVVDPHDRKIVHAVSGDGCGVVRSTDSGRTFKETYSKPRRHFPKTDVPAGWNCPAENQIGAVAPDGSRKGVVYAVGHSGVLRSKNSGKSWKRVRDAPSLEEGEEVRAAAATGGVLLVVTDDQAVYGTRMEK